jgi:uncharacterized coiled-coil DUF342 family protein
LVERLKLANEEYKKKIEEKKKQLEEKKEPIKKLVESMDQAKKEITEANLKKVYNFLEKKYNEACVYVMEALVGLMRGMKRADQMSVKLYTEKHEGFMLGLNRIDIKNLEVKNCQEHLDNLREKYDKTLASEEFEIFRPYRNVLSKLCLLSMLGKDEFTIE